MNSIADRLTRAYCLFHWLNVKPIPDQIRSSLSFAALEQELLALQVKPEDFSSVAADGADNFSDSRLAFMVRYSGLTWSTCSVFCDAIEHNDWIHSGTPYLITFDPGNHDDMAGLPRANISDFMFLKPQKVWMKNGSIKSFVIRWNPHEARRMERFIRLAGARRGIEIRMDSIAYSEKFLNSIKAAVGA